MFLLKTSKDSFELFLSGVFYFKAGSLICGSVSVEIYFLVASDELFLHVPLLLTQLSNFLITRLIAV